MKSLPSGSGSAFFGLGGGLKGFYAVEFYGMSGFEKGPTPSSRVGNL